MPAPTSSEHPRGSIAVRHGDHIDRLEGGRLLHYEGGKTVAHLIGVSTDNPNRCEAAHQVKAEGGHVHGPSCGHAAVPHGDHIDYFVDGRMHHPHGDHVDDHGPLLLA